MKTTLTTVEKREESKLLLKPIANLELEQSIRLKELMLKKTMDTLLNTRSKILNADTADGMKTIKAISEILDMLETI